MFIPVYRLVLLKMIFFFKLVLKNSIKAILVVKNFRIWAPKYSYIQARLQFEF